MHYVRPVSYVTIISLAFPATQYTIEVLVQKAGHKKGLRAKLQKTEDDSRNDF